MMQAPRSGFVSSTGTVGGAKPFCGKAVCSRTVVVPVQCARRSARIHMASEANTAVKAAKVESARAALEESTFVFQVPLPGISVSQVSELKQKLPEGSTCRTVKNTLMKRAIEGTEWSVIGDLCSGSTVWFFVKDDIKGTVEAYKKFAKEHKRPEINGGCMDSVLYDVNGVKTIADLPSMDELRTKIACLVKAVPTKLARTVKAVPTKVGRAINLAVADDSGDSAASTE